MSDYKDFPKEELIRHIYKLESKIDALNLAPRLELTAHKAVIDRVTKERDEARAALREAIDAAEASEQAWLMLNTLNRWRKAAGVNTANS